MKTKQWIALLTLVPAFLLCGMCTLVSAQSNVALVDVGKIFEAHPRFTQELQQLKVEADQFKANSVQLREQMVAKSEKLKIYEPGSEEFRNAETALAQELARLEVEQRDLMRKLMQREAQLHFETYQQVKNLIQQYSQNQGIRLVLRHSEQKLDVDDPNSIMQHVNGSIVYYAPGRDITGAIIQQLNGSASLPANPNR